jgi:hypothetical protein
MQSDAGSNAESRRGTVSKPDESNIVAHVTVIRRANRNANEQQDFTESYFETVIVSRISQLLYGSRVVKGIACPGDHPERAK